MYVFFFQAEDGIRDLVRSRGLGDVYKRQSQEFMAAIGEPVLELERWQLRNSTALHALSSHILAEVTRTSGTTPPEKRAVIAHLGAVSYTHLTLPTSDLV